MFKSGFKSGVAVGAALAWYEALGHALGTALVDHCRISMLADGYRWARVLDTTWKHLAQSIRVKQESA